MLLCAGPRQCGEVLERAVSSAVIQHRSSDTRRRDMTFHDHDLAELPIWSKVFAELTATGFIASHLLAIAAASSPFRIRLSDA